MYHPQRSRRRLCWVEELSVPRHNQLLQGSKTPTCRHRKGPVPISRLVCRRHPELQQGFKPRQADEMNELGVISGQHTVYHVLQIYDRPCDCRRERKSWVGGVKYTRMRPTQAPVLTARVSQCFATLQRDVEPRPQVPYYRTLARREVAVLNEHSRTNTGPPCH